MSKAQGARVALLLPLLPLTLFLLSFTLGRYPIPLPLVLKILAAKFFPLTPHWPDTMETVLWDLRLPRALGAMMVGAALSVSGCAFQGLFRNPLVSPYVLGVAAGSGFGACLAILFTETRWVVQLSATLFGLVAVLGATSLSGLYRKASTLVLVLGGIIVGSFFSALISLLKFQADPYEKLPAMVFWLMGSLARVSLTNLLAVAPVMAVGLGILLALRWRLNLLAFGEQEAQALGAEVVRERWLVILACTLLTSSAVCLAGVIGWVGLVIPHIGRLLVGPDLRRLLPASLFLGSFYLLLVDTLSRTLSASEIPLGILTALIGAPFFAWLLTRNQVAWR